MRDAAPPLLSWIYRKLQKATFKDALYVRGVPVWHANFEPINSLHCLKSGLGRSGCPGLIWNVREKITALHTWLRTK